MTRLARLYAAARRRDRGRLRAQPARDRDAARPARRAHHGDPGRRSARSSRRRRSTRGAARALRPRRRATSSTSATSCRTRTCRGCCAPGPRCPSRCAARISSCWPAATARGRPALGGRRPRRSASGTGVAFPGLIDDADLPALYAGAAGVRPAVARGRLRPARAGGDGLRRAGGRLAPGRAARGGRRRRPAGGSGGRARAGRRARAGARRARRARAAGRARAGRARGSSPPSARPGAWWISCRRRSACGPALSAEGRLMCGIAGIVGRAPRRRVLDAMLDGARAPRARRSRRPRERRRRPRHDAPGDHRSRHRPAADDERRRRARRSSSTARSTTSARCAPSSRRAGHRFRTQSDTEVILRAWQARRRGVRRAPARACSPSRSGTRGGSGCSWPATGSARSRSTTGRTARTLVFASEIKALLCHPGPGRDGGLAGAASLPGLRLHAGHALGLRRHRQARRPATPRRFADGRADRAPLLDAAGGDAARPSPGWTRASSAEARARARLREAVRLRLESDVPLGAFLSGGVDSSVVVASMREVTSGRITTFTSASAPPRASYDELPYARQVAERFEHRAPRGDPRAQGRRAGADHRARLRRAVRRLLRHPDLRRGGGHRAPRQGRAVRDRRRRDLRRLSALSRPARLRVRGRACRAALRVPAGALAAARCSASPTRAATCATGSCASPPAPSSRCRIATWPGRASSAPRDLTALATPALRARLDRRRGGATGARPGPPAATAMPMDGAFRDRSGHVPAGRSARRWPTACAMASSLELRAPFCDHRLIEASLSIAAVGEDPRLPAQVAAQDGLRRRAAAAACWSTASRAS